MTWRRRLGWKPGDLGWRVAVLFMVGSTLFALGSFPAYVSAVDAGVDAATFAMGSVFFTAAAYSQFLMVVNPEPRAGTFRFWAWETRSLDWWATIVQFAGTLFFNVSTFAALITYQTIQQEDRLVWRPDFLGSIAFLAASHFAWLSVCHRLWCVQRDVDEWWVAALNYIGSMFFMASAIAAFILPTTGEVINIAIVNLGTFGGAVCFFLGAYLLLPPVPAIASEG